MDGGRARNPVWQDMLHSPMRSVSQALAQTRRGILSALRARAGVFGAVAAAVAAFNLLAPVALLSIIRKPLDFFTFNPWLRRLPDYLAGPAPLGAKLEFLWEMKLAWVSADAPGPDGGIEWSFIVDVKTLAQIACTALIFGAWFALWSHLRDTSPAARSAGLVGAATSVFGLGACPCTLAGCGAPVLPVMSLAFTGLSGGTLLIFATLSRAGITAVLVLMVAAIGWFGWRAGAQPQP